MCFLQNNVRPLDRAPKCLLSHDLSAHQLPLCQLCIYCVPNPKKRHLFLFKLEHFSKFCRFC